MKNFLCYIGIVILVILIILPPALRIFLPEEKEKEKIEPKLVIKSLNCTGVNYVTGTSYENDEVKMIVLKKIISSDDENQDENTDNQETQDETKEEDSYNNPDSSERKTEFEAVFTRLSEDSRITKSNLNDGIALKIDFSISNNLDLDIKDLTKPINDQLIYYENLGLTCSIMQ